MLLDVKRGFLVNLNSQINVIGTPIFIKSSLLDIAQNDPVIGDIIMEGSPYKLYGCRVVGLHRNADYLLNPFLERHITLQETDAILDKGEEKSDARQNGNIWNVANGAEYVRRINKKFGVSFKYSIIRPKEIGVKKTKIAIKELILSDTPAVIKMSSSVGKTHFVNMDGFIEDSESGIAYIRMSETYRNYNGYDKKWCLVEDPGYYEIISR